MTKMTYEDWEIKYKPDERNPFLRDPRIQRANPVCVWTELEVDGVITIVNGIHYINREAHYICAVPFIEHEFIEVDNTDYASFSSSIKE